MALVCFPDCAFLRHDLFHRPEHESTHVVVLVARDLGPGNLTHPSRRKLETSASTRDGSNHGRVRVPGKLASGGRARPARRKLGTPRSPGQFSTRSWSRPFGPELWSSPSGIGNGDTDAASHCHAIAAAPTHGASHRTRIPRCRPPADIHNDDAHNTSRANRTKVGLLRQGIAAAPTHGAASRCRGSRASSFCSPVDICNHDAHNTGYADRTKTSSSRQSMAEASPRKPGKSTRRSCGCMT